MNCEVYVNCVQSKTHIQHLMYRNNHFFVVFLLVCVCSYNNAEHAIKNNTTCLVKEREALLGFKKGLIGPSGIFSSWKGENCCSWRGVVCSNHSDPAGLQHITKVDLGNPSSPDDDDYFLAFLEGNINVTSLHALEFLDYLDLSYNGFNDAEIDASFGGLKKLSYLNLSNSQFSGEISPQIGNLSRLEYLDLSANYGLKATNIRWLSSLTSLVYLSLDIIPLSKDVFHSVNKLPFLVDLHLYDCGLSKLPYSLPNINFTSLAVLDLSYNNFISSVPPSWFFNLTSLVILHLEHDIFGGVITDWDFSNFKVLEYLYFSFIDIAGQVPRTLGNLCKLKHLDLSNNRLNGTMNDFFQGFSNCTNGSSLMHLDLSNNQFDGEIPATIGLVKHLQHLDLIGNNFNGTIPQNSIGQLEELSYLGLGEQHYEGLITELLFMNLKRLEYFHIGSNKVSFTMTLDLMPPFRLTYLSITNCHVGPKIPKWILVQSKLTKLVLRNVSISDILPANWISKMSPQLEYLDLSENKFMGELPEKMPNPLLSSMVLILSYNNIVGQIPSWICKVEYLQLSNNQLSGPLPACLNEGSMNLRFLDISHNTLTGKLSLSLFNSSSLRMLLLSDNHLEGELPVSFYNSSLGSFDVGGNMLSGTLKDFAPAAWVVRLRSNYFHGPIPETWCDNPYLHILDLADNNLSGPIPECVSDLKALRAVDYNEISNYATEEEDLNEEIIEITKGIEQKYIKITSLVKIIDLSRNNLSDKIPVGLMNLTGLGTLNLSMNHLSGRIPENVGNLRLLETLDLSNNHLSGEIPQSISSMTSLNHLDLSYNKLEGRIPSGRQLETMNDSSIYEGNPLLCGLPLPNKCHEDEGDSPGVYNTKEGDEDLLWFFVSMAAGYIFGLGGVCFVLWLSVSFRKTYFGFFRLY